MSLNARDIQVCWLLTLMKRSVYSFIPSLLGGWRRNERRSTIRDALKRHTLLLPVRAMVKKENRVPVTHGLFETVRFPSCFLAYNTLADWITRALHQPASALFSSRIGLENVNVVAHNQTSRRCVVNAAITRFW